MSNAKARTLVSRSYGSLVSKMDISKNLFAEIDRNSVCQKLNARDHIPQYRLHRFHTRPNIRPKEFQKSIDC